MDSQQTKLRVAIVGGSLSGLMCGIALKHAGHTVTIIEKEGDIRQSHKAGIVLGPDTRDFLQIHDRHTTQPFSSPSYRVQALLGGKEEGATKLLAKAHRDVTSWDALYFRLRSCFDGYASSYYPSPPSSSPTDGFATFLTRKEVVDLSRDDSPQSLTLTIRDRDTDETAHREVDLVIGADGPNSFIRTRYLPVTPSRQYVGYVVWRATIPERELSASTRKVFQESLTICTGPQQYCMAYMIPGADGTLEPGERVLNLAWYTNEPPERLEELLTDSLDGHRHATTVPAGRVRPDVWARQVAQARAAQLFPAPCLEVLDKVQHPFVHTITELPAPPRAAFEDGQVLLVGDALCLFRPHVGAGATQCAFDALCVADYVSGKATLAQWEDRVLRYARLQAAQAVWWGMWYMAGFWTAAVPAGLRYWGYRALEIVRSWWSG